ncbi:MAG: tetratricopeptide repeat protein [Minicystis sp.]
MARWRDKDERGSRSPRPRAVALAGAVLLSSIVLAVPLPALAGPGDTQAQKGMLFARKRNCAKAIPLLEEAELARHRPSVALALADCYVATGELLKASELYHVILADKPQRFWVRTDYNARKAAQKKAQDVDARIPTLSFKIEGEYEELEIEVDGKPVADPAREKQVQPDVAVTIVARAKGRKEHTDKVVLNEGERRAISIRLDRAAPAVPKAVPAARPTSWLGARYYGVILPKFVMNIVADGGRNLVVPGGAFTFTTQATDAEITVALGYLSYRMADTPFKPHGQPDTEWEWTSSSLQAITATVDLMWSFPLDAAKNVNFRIGGAAGVGWMFLGDLNRVQSYPRDGKPGDPSTYLKCAGPNNPRGTFRYCNALDKDATHYPGYSEPDWFHRGIRPLVFPWLVLPQVGFSFRPSRSVAIDLDTGVSISGFLTSLGFRVGL